MDLYLSQPHEIVRLICERLRTERLSQNRTQAEIAGRAGIGVNTVSNLEAGRNVALESLVRVAMVLGRQEELKQLFKPKLESLDDIVRYENGATRLRVKRKRSDA